MLEHTCFLTQMLAHHITHHILDEVGVVDVGGRHGVARVQAVADLLGGLPVQVQGTAELVLLRWW